MKKMMSFLLSGLLLLLAWFIFSAFQPAIIIGESDNWKATYKPRKGDAADSISYPWNGRITWKNKEGNLKLLAVDGSYEGAYKEILDKDASVKKGNINEKMLTSLFSTPSRLADFLRFPTRNHYR
ncbi:Uncharacterised protein [Listeria grayi]|uniref:Uncharacterized protein n=1 Tax=Listeria grayi TaxID=1641 RepID=A0A378MB60_LISGR|nr:hypothetical protein [Listeria grayi]STY42763.1 Uncharacterised protein [Listeria grayi]